jgi:hypothetical protein
MIDLISKSDFSEIYRIPSKIQLGLGLSCSVAGLKEARTIL